MNQGTFAGRLGRDAEVRHTPSGQSVCNFSVAVNVGWGDRKETLWIGCALWGERGEKLAQYLTKGAAVTVSGDIGLRTWDRDGRQGAEITLNVQRVTLQGGNDRRGAEPAQPAGASRSAPAPAAATTQAEADFDDDLDIPF